MSSLLRKAIVKETGMQGINEFQKSPISSMTIEETGDTRPVTDRSTEFELRVILGVRFWCNKAQYRDALQNAEKQMLRLIHQDMLREVQDIRSAIFNGKASLAVKLCDRLEELIGL